MNKHFDTVNGHDINNNNNNNNNNSNNNSNSGQPRRLSTEKNRIYDRVQLSEKEFYEEFKARHKYNRSERKDLIRMAKKIYVH